VDDRSGAAYQEYRCVYGEDVEAALRFLYNAMTAKTVDGFPFQGIPQVMLTCKPRIRRLKHYDEYAGWNIMTCFRRVPKLTAQ